jgi:ribosome maturation factor RimP
MAKKGGNIAGIAYTAAKPIADELGLDIWDIVYEKEGSDWFLRVYIERPDGIISIDDCVAMSKPLDKALDDLDPTDEPYVLEVSSPGLGRKLTKPEHFERYVGEAVVARYVRAQNGVRDVSGVLRRYDKDVIMLETESGEAELKRSLLAFIKADDIDLFNE